MNILLLLILAAPAPLTVPQQVAAHALGGDYGPLAPWQIEGYTQIAERGAEKRVAVVTHYSRKECKLYRLPGYSKPQPLTATNLVPVIGRTAAMLHVQLPRPHAPCPWSYVLVDLPEGMRLLRVEDTGSSRNDPMGPDPFKFIQHYRNQGATDWVDVYEKDALRNVVWVRPVWVAKAREAAT